jgi:3-hydroxyisobutyrate dehydrogenase-like beta-hydroxyacid dehydrogenase
VKVGFLGTGIMGGHMARRLAAAGASVHAWNRSTTKVEALAAHGVMRVATPSAALDGSDVAIVMLSNGPVCDAVLFDADDSGRVPAGALAPGATLVVMSSIPVETARAQAARVSGRGVRYVDAPVSGGEPGARDGTLAIMAGGEADAVRDVATALAPLGRVTHLGPAGSGQLAKLANQVIVGGTLVAIAEALELVRRGGADPAAVREAWLGGFADSKVLRVLGERMVTGDFTPGSPAAYQLKDMRTAEAFARSLGVRLEVFESVIALFQAVADRGEGDRDVSIVAREVSRRAAA